MVPGATPAGKYQVEDEVLLRTVLLVAKRW
jgi:hypothetical protein